MQGTTQPRNHARLSPDGGPQHRQARPRRHGPWGAGWGDQEPRAEAL